MNNDTPARAQTAREPIAYTNYLAIKAVWEAENANLIEILRKMEYAVNRSVSGMKVDIGEWLQLIQAAREVLGDRVMDAPPPAPRRATSTAASNTTVPTRWRRSYTRTRRNATTTCTRCWILPAASQGGATTATPARSRICCGMCKLHSRSWKDGNMMNNDARAATPGDLTRCTCCGKPTPRGSTYADLPCCWDCYITGDLLKCLDEAGEWKTAAPAPHASGTSERD